MLKKKLKEIDISEEEGERAIQNVLHFTKEFKKFEKKISTIIKDLEERGYFNE